MTARQVSTAGMDAGQRRIAARHLLASPILTASRDPAELELVRRYAPALKSMFAAQLGYALVVESTFARLVKAPLSLLDADRRRMDATSAARVSLDELMRTGGQGQANRTGYLWLELAGPGSTSRSARWSGTASPRPVQRSGTSQPPCGSARNCP